MSMTKSVSLAILGLAFLQPELALAQDPSPSEAKPNVLFLIDTSGSMEYKTEFDDFNDRYPTCHPGVPAQTNEKSRWIEVIEVLAGEIPDAGYSCESVSRSGANFKTEFSMPNSSVEPPDADYQNPYHRPISSNCLWTPDRVTPVTNAFNWVPPVQVDYPLSLSAVSGCISGLPCCTFRQDPGFVDGFTDLVRFGLMTFDPLPDKERGFDSSFSPEYANGVSGTWSYFDSDLGYAEGNPVGCIDDVTFEVGVRNGAAPASEGKMIYFGDPNADTTKNADRHDRIKKVLMSTRPYGATPLNGALSDVRNFFWKDDDIDPLEPTPNVAPDLYISPRYDDTVECGCRKQHVILITDGEPNLDMRPDCESDGVLEGISPGGVCPFPDDPETILKDLYNQDVYGDPGDPDDPDTTPQSCNVSPNKGKNKWRIPTHVIGFATSTYDLNDGNGKKLCKDLNKDQPTWDQTSGICATTTNEDLRICCTLWELASAGSGGDEEPYIAPNGADLQSALADIITDLVSLSASATRPVRSPGIGRAQDPGEQVAFRILTSYETDTGESGLWRGNVERLRWTCDGGVATEQEKDLTKGDDFAYNVAKNVSDRNFYTLYPALTSGIGPTDTIRPYYVTSNPSDGLGGIATITPKKDSSSAFVTSVDPEALSLTSANYTSQGACTLDSVTANAGACRTRVLGWTLGFDDGEGRNRCATVSEKGDCSLIGHVMHSNPLIVDRPKAPVEDETYTAFAKANQGRMMMMYVSSNDGILHGFAVSPNNATDDHLVTNLYNNEHFAFIPPFVLPQLKDQYPNVPTKLLDSSAVVQDVVAIVGGFTSGYPYKLQRTLSDTAALTNTWRTILVQGFGGEQSGYFALDITDAQQPTSSDSTKGPQFLWQISRTSSGPLFGKGGTPLITTLNVDGKEVAVAVLPGGHGGSSVGTKQRHDTDITGSDYKNTYYDETLSGGPSSGPRPNISSYAAADVAANSLTIVRLDNGEIIRTFWYAAPTELANVDGNQVSFLDSPITGIPAAFPSGTGMIADRIFVGDQDGVMWRVDVSSSDPKVWTMKLFYDSYGHGSDTPTGGKPITIAPVLSVNETGQITIAYATGAQDLSGGSGDVQYIYSLTEAENGNAFYASVNWWQRLTTGEHILGPMTLNDEILYFSTLNPAAGSPCTKYPSNIWGVDYVNPADPSDLSAGGVARFPVGSDYEQFADAQSLSSGSGTVGPVFGVSVEYAPSCSTPDSAVANGFLPGTRTRVSDPSSSNLQLVFQTGTVDTGKQGLKFTTGFESRTLPQPRIPSALLSWAAILD